MIQLFEGDPRIFIEKNGSKLIFKSGQPVMDAGLENAVIISLFTRLGWWGNIFFTNVSEQIGSDFETIVTGTINRFYFTKVENSVRRAVQWLLDNKTISKIDITVTNPEFNTTNLLLTLFPPGKTTTELLLIKNGINWIFQVNNPAYLRR